MNLGEIIKKFRDDNELSMDKFAKMSGLSKAYISVLEKNKRPITGKPVTPSIPVIKNVAEAMNMSFDELFNIMQNNFFATNLKFLRTKKGLEQKDISDFLGLKSPTSVTNWEKGTNLARAGHLSDLASFFNVSLHDLVKVDLSKENEANTITEIYNQLNSDRQTKVYDFATEQLNEQNNNVVNISDYIEEETNWYEVKFYGSVSAGTGLYLDDEQVETINFGADMIPTGTDFCLKVNGDSMEPMFNNGDYVFIKRETDFRNGSIGVVIVNGEAYLKKIYITDNSIRLVSLNKKYKDITVTQDDTLKYVGTVVF